MNRRAKLKNDYEIRGDVTAIFIVRRDGTCLETLISTSDLEKVKSYPNTWCVKFDSHINSYYVTGMLKKPNGKNTTIRLHRLILDTPREMVVDHINHDTLNNTRENLRVITNKQNQQNKIIERTNTTSGIMDVTFHRHSGRWRCVITVNGNTYHLGYYDDVKEAEEVVVKARSVLMPFSKEAENPNGLNYSKEEFLKEYLTKKILGRKSKSGHLGVHWNNTSQRWRSYHIANGKKKYLGSFKNKQDAINAVKNLY
jgi:hypothetical protein